MRQLINDFHKECREDRTLNSIKTVGGLLLLVFAVVIVSVIWLPLVTWGIAIGSNLFLVSLVMLFEKKRIKKIRSQFIIRNLPKN